MLRDGARLAAWASRARPERRATFQRAAERGWWTLGAYLRRAAALAFIEAIAMGLALLLSGGGLVAPGMIVPPEPCLVQGREESGRIWVTRPGRSGEGGALR